MTAVKATVRKGRLELDEPLDLPDGTELSIPLSGIDTDNNDDRLSPEEIARILKLMDETPAMQMSEGEIQQWEDDRKLQRDLEMEAFEKYCILRDI